MKAFFFVAVLMACMLSSCSEPEQYADSSEYFLLEDSSASLNASAAWQRFGNGSFQRQPSHSFNPGFTTFNYWLVVKIDSSAQEDLQLAIGTSQINEIEFYTILDHEPKRKYHTGDHKIYSTRPLPSLDFIFPLDKGVIYHLLKIDKRNESLQLTFAVKPAAFFTTEAIGSSMIIGVLTGIIILMLIFGLYLTLITKEGVYLLYILYVTAGWLYVLSNLGYGYKYLWPDNPWFSARARPIFTLLSLGFSLLFIEYYTGKAAYRWLHRTMRVLAYLAFALIVFTLVPAVNLKMNTLGYYFQVLLPLMALTYIITILTTLIQKILNKNTMAMFYLFSILPIAVFSALQVFYYSGGVDISGSFLQEYGQASGFIMEAVILTFGLAYRFNSYRLEKEQLLVEVNQQQVKHTKTIISTQASERRKLADQLHDVAGSLLSAAKLNLSSVREKNFITNPEARAKLNQAENAVTDIAEMLRNLSHAISPVMLDKVGFRQSVEKIARIFNTSGKINVEIEVIGFEMEQPGMHEKYSVLYGILYELVNNITKHANATNALIQLVEHEDSVVMIVEDNGKGLDATMAKTSATHGLAAIQSKIHYLNGTITYDKADPHGLIVTIEIPKNEA